MNIKIGQKVRINAPKSGYHEMTGQISKGPFLDHKGRLASLQVEINGERIWFAASAVQINDQEQAA